MIIAMYMICFQVSVDLIPLLQQADLEKLGLVHVGKRVLLLSLAKAQQSKFHILIQV